MPKTRNALNELREDQLETWMVKKEHSRRDFACGNILALPQITSYVRIHVILTLHMWINQHPQINKPVSLDL